MSSFTGLPKDYFDFFRELKANNNRTWFNDNKPRFRTSVQEPLASLVEAMAPHLKKVSKHFVADPRLHGGSVFRIYKDVRFSKDKKPYKTHGGVQFRHALGKDAHAPGFYVHLDPEEIFYGGGVWAPPSPQLLLIREAIRVKGAAWKKATTGASFEKRFGELRGDSLKRPPRGFDAEHPLIGDIKRKSFFAMAEAKPARAKKPALVDDIADAFADAKPLMKFLCTAVGAPI
ncbi:MAG: DUF2461 domain-containing protein [Alphaproteobacteria bacterium]|nr:DUF2461 domain-containing protein [Alphaproteobacteria bacterium]